MWTEKERKERAEGTSKFQRAGSECGMMFISVESGAGGLRRGSDLGMCREVKRGLSGRKSGFNPANRNSADSERFLRSVGVSDVRCLFFAAFVFIKVRGHGGCGNWRFRGE